MSSPARAIRPPCLSFTQELRSVALIALFAAAKPRARR